VQLFEFCSGCPDIRVVLKAMGLYYACALAVRLVMRKVIGLKPSFPQFWWEGMPTKSAARM
jgi:hypothetical protein